MTVFNMHAALDLEGNVRGPSVLRDVTVVLAGNLPEDRLLSMERYARMLREGLSERGIKVVLATPQAWLGKLPKLPARVAKIAGYIDKYVLFPLLLRWRLQRIRRHGPVVVHVTDQGNGLYLPWLRGFPLVVTNHDLLAIRDTLGEFPQKPQNTGIGWGQRAIRRALRMADSVTCVSGQSLDDGRRLLDSGRQQFFLVPNALDPKYLLDKPLARPDDLPQSYVLHVGNSSWYKNRTAVLRIHAAMRQQDPSSPALVFIGDQLSPQESNVANELGLAGQFIVRERPPDDYVMAAYDAAKALIFPSIAEGFGWPLLEAMAAGCPVFTSDRAPMTEVGGSVAEYFDPDAPAIAAARILQCLAQGAEWRKSKAEAGKQWAATFTVTRFIDSMLEVYASTLGKHAQPSPSP